MSDRNWKKRFREEYRISAPNRKDQLKMQLGLSINHPRKFAFSFRHALSIAFLSIFLFILIFVQPPATIANSMVTIDINPSVEIEVDASGNVIDVKPLNLDGEILLQDNEILFAQKTIEEAIAVILDLAGELGYLDMADEEKIVRISAIHQNEEEEARLAQLIETRVMNYRTQKSALFQTEINDFKDDIKALAKDLGISNGLMNSIQEARQNNPNLSIKEALKLSQGELNRIARQYNQQDVDDFKSVYQGAIADFNMKKEEAIQQAQNEEQVEQIKQKYRSEINALKIAARNQIRESGRIDPIDYELDDDFSQQSELPVDPEDPQIEIKINIQKKILVLRSLIQNAKRSNGMRMRLLQTIIANYNEYRHLLEQTDQSFQDSAEINLFEVYYQNFIENN